MADTTNGAASWAQMTGASADAAPTAETTQGGISWEQMSGQAPAPSGWEKFKGLLAQGETVLGAPKALQGVQQIGQEVKALTNMLVGIPGGVAGVAWILARGLAPWPSAKMRSQLGYGPGLRQSIQTHSGVR